MFRLTLYLEEEVNSDMRTILLRKQASSTKEGVDELLDVFYNDMKKFIKEQSDIE